MVKRDRKAANNIDRTSTRHLSSKTVRREAKEAASIRRGLLFFTTGDIWYNISDVNDERKELVC